MSLMQTIMHNTINLTTNI